MIPFCAVWWRGSKILHAFNYMQEKMDFQLSRKSRVCNQDAMRCCFVADGASSSDDPTSAYLTYVPPLLLAVRFEVIAIIAYLKYLTQLVSIILVWPLTCTWRSLRTIRRISHHLAPLLHPTEYKGNSQEWFNLIDISLPVELYTLDPLLLVI